MCMGGSTPKPPPPPPPPPEPAQEQDAAVVKARSDERARAIAARGAAGTILTNPQGNVAAAPTAKTLLGQ
jgi:hypothetical protein